MGGHAHPTQQSGPAFYTAGPAKTHRSCSFSLRAAYEHRILGKSSKPPLPPLPNSVSNIASRNRAMTGCFCAELGNSFKLLARPSEDCRAHATKLRECFAWGNAPRQVTCSTVYTFLFLKPPPPALNWLKERGDYFAAVLI